MARYSYQGEIKRPKLVVKYGPCIAIRLHLKDGTKQEIRAKDPKVGFVVGQDIGVEITDTRVIRHMDIDPRFKRIS